jgi:hypothetical protein
MISSRLKDNTKKNNSLIKQERAITSLKENIKIIKEIKRTVADDYYDDLTCFVKFYLANYNI